MVNGDGLRVTLFVSGCNHYCKDCHNPQTWDPNEGISFDQDAIDEIFMYLSKDYISGVTLTGGDPLYPQNRKEIFELVRRIKTVFGNTKNIWMYTGYEWEEIKDLPLISFVDVLVDGQFDINRKDSKLHFVGSSNQNIIDVKKSIETGEKVLYIIQDTDIEPDKSIKTPCEK